MRIDGTRERERVICGKYLQPTEAVLIDFNLVEC